MDIDQVRQRLLALRDELQQHLDTNADASDTVELDQTRVGRLSRIDALQAQAISQASDRRLDLLRARIAPALQRLERGEYGECIECGELISARRLEVDPTCALCIECAQEHENQRR